MFEPQRIPQIARTRDSLAAAGPSKRHCRPRARAPNETRRTPTSPVEVLAERPPRAGVDLPPGKRERVGVLVELGQIALTHGDEACRTMARAVCAEPHSGTTREAAAEVRRYRLGLPEPGPAVTSDDFQEALEIALAETVEHTPEIPLEVLQATIQNFAAELEELVDIVRQVVSETH